MDDTTIIASLTTPEAVGITVMLIGITVGLAVIAHIVVDILGYEAF